MKPVGAVTRGTTGVNRLRRVDRWLVGVHGAVLRDAAAPLVVDLGYGASPVTTVEMFHRLRAVRSEVEVVGVEIDADRVSAAQICAEPGLVFVRGGFEMPLPSPAAPVVVRAFNVLRQYPEDAVAPVWDGLRSRLAPGGLVIEGTCDEIGRRASWVCLDAAGPVSLTFAAHLGSLPMPSVLAERLPKALIHRNVPGEPIHELLADFDRAWAAAAPYRAFGARQRWMAACLILRERWPLLGDRHRWRLGEATFRWCF